VGDLSVGKSQAGGNPVSRRIGADVCGSLVVGEMADAEASRSEALRPTPACFGAIRPKEAAFAAVSLCDLLSGDTPTALALEP
jgi:hypothetical protein